MESSGLKFVLFPLKTTVYSMHAQEHKIWIFIIRVQMASQGVTNNIQRFIYVAGTLQMGAPPWEVPLFRVQ